MKFYIEANLNNNVKYVRSAKYQTKYVQIE